MVWHFCTVQDLNKIEKVQYRALLYVNNYFTASYATLREMADRPLMYVQRLRQMMTDVYKAYHNNGPVYMENPFNLFRKKDPLHGTRCIKPLQQPSFNTVTYGRKSFFVSRCKRMESFK